LGHRIETARTLLPHDDDYAAISFVNVSGVDQSLIRGLALGVAASCSSDLVRPLVDTSHNLAVQPEGEIDNTPTNEPINVDGSDKEAMSDVGDMQVKCASIHAADNQSPTAAASDRDDYSHIQPVIDKLPSSLTAEQRKQAIVLIKRNADVFSRSEFDVGCTNLVTARIVTNGQGPIAEPLRRHARVHLDVIADTIERMKDAGIVEEAASPWAANLVVVSCRDDKGNPTTPRITIDYRGLNSITYRDRYLIPNLKDCLHALDNKVPEHYRHV